MSDRTVVSFTSFAAARPVTYFPDESAMPIIWWHNGAPDSDRHIIETARRCRSTGEPFSHDGINWCVTYVGLTESEDDDFVIEGVALPVQYPGDHP